MALNRQIAVLEERVNMLEARLAQPSQREYMTD
jgi:hypothetical protein